MTELQENVVGRSKNVSKAVHERWTDAVNRRKTVHGRNQVSGWEDFRYFLKRSPAFCSENIPENLPIPDLIACM